MLLIGRLTGLAGFASVGNNDRLSPGGVGVGGGSGGGGSDGGGIGGGGSGRGRGRGALYPHDGCGSFT
jgi:hypothetical protein